MHAILKISKFIEGITFDQFAADDKTTFAVLRALEIIGEAKNNLTIHDWFYFTGRLSKQREKRNE